MAETTLLRYVLRRINNVLMGQQTCNRNRCGRPTAGYYTVCYEHALWIIAAAHLAPQPKAWSND